MIVSWLDITIKLSRAFYVGLISRVIIVLILLLLIIIIINSNFNDNTKYQNIKISPEYLEAFKVESSILYILD